MSGPTFGVVYVVPDNSVKVPAEQIPVIAAQIDRGEQWVTFTGWGGTEASYRAARIDGWHISTPAFREAMYEIKRELDTEEKAALPEWEDRQ